MPDYKRNRIPRMRDLTIAEQNAYIARWKARNALRTAYPEVIGAMMQWVIDSPDIDAFVAQGHEAHFNRTPIEDLFMRMAANGFTDEEIEAAVLQSEPPTNWMSANELESVIYRIDRMLNYFQTHDPGTFQQALQIYRAIARAARTLFTQQYGYFPEQSPIEHVRITGEDSEQKKLKPRDYQPPLL